MTMVKKSGGTAAVIKSLRHNSSKTRFAQLAIFTMGIVFFFDPYVSIMVVGKVFGSIVNRLPLSIEKMSFLIDTTAVPVASIFPKSTWMIFVGDLVQAEIDKITESGVNELSFSSGYSLALSSISYQFYPSMVLGLALLHILTGREMGPMLEAEKQARFSYSTTHQDDKYGMTIKKRKWNWYIPVVALNVFLWFAFSQIGKDGESYDPSFVANTWLTSTVATIFLTQVFFLVQKRNGKLPFVEFFLERRERHRLAYLTDTFPSVSSSSSSASILYNLSAESEDSDGFLKDSLNHDLEMLEKRKREKGNKPEKPNRLGCLKDAPLMNLREGIGCVVHGIATSIPISLSLICAWATGSVYIALGVDRVIISWILHDNLSTEILPVVVFLAAFLLSLITGSSWCCISILIPGTMSPLAKSLGDDSKVLVLILASILSGAAAGDNIGPFSETTILSAIITGSEVRRHFLTQAPYGLFAFLLSVSVGTLPISYDIYPVYVGHVVGVALLIVFIIFVCRQVERYQSSIPGQIQDTPITQGFHAMMALKERISRQGSPIVSSKSGAGDESHCLEPNLEQVSILNSATQQGTKVVDYDNGTTSIRIQNISYLNSSGVHDSILGLVEHGHFPEDTEKPSTNENKKCLIEATIKKAEEDGNVFSDSLRLFLRTAEQKLGNILDTKENLKISRSGSADSTGDDSLDHLMMDIAAKGWRQGIKGLLGDDLETSTSGAGEYTTDGRSALVETDDSATATLSSLGGNGQSTYFTGRGQSTYFSGIAGATSCASSATGHSEYTKEWDDSEEFSSQIDDIFSATDYTKLSF